MVLISTIDVYGSPVGVDEGDHIDEGRAAAYGRHRYHLERRVADRFDALIIRLPGLFGEGLKKNAIYDFLHGNELYKIDSRAVYQFYPLAYLWGDIEVALRAGLRVVNVATEPISVREMAREGFDLDFANEAVEEPARYDFRTRHDHLYGGSGGYLYTKPQILRELRSFVAASRERKRCA